LLGCDASGGYRGDPGEDAQENEINSARDVACRIGRYKISLKVINSGKLSS